MRYYFKIYKRLIRLNFALILTYRMSFLNSIVATIGWGFFQIIWIYMLTYRTKSVFGWSRDELIILAVCYIIIIAIFHLLFSRNFERLSRIIDRGQLDSLLLKPADSQFLISVWIIRYANIFRIGMGVGLLLFLLNNLHITVSLINIIGFFILIIFGLVLLYSLWFIFSTSLIWFPQLTNLVDFLYTINGMSRYPTEMIKTLPFYLLPVLIPFTITIVTPTKALLGRILAGDVIGLILITSALFFLSRIFWKFALRHYTSASS
jgi:ABC-2 type transport system permease protein